MIFSLMYNKISQIVLNSGKSNGVSDVFVSQPDAIKESLAGKVFVVAEIEGKKNDSRKILDFIITSLEDYYYNDEKIVLRDKIEGLKIENIFEAALAKTNKALADFLNSEKTQLNPLTTNITLGIVYENKLHFSNYGKNRALLIFPRKENYDIANIEANASESEEETSSTEVAKAKTPKLFSSIISGDIPVNSYFVFTNETLPEYLSDAELTKIVTKLPPIVASEHIKNTLAKMNSYVPFLGIIIKSTLGTVSLPEEEAVDSLSAHTSISALKHTEQRTEEMLSPAGLIDLRKLVQKSTGFLNKFSPKKTESKRKIIKHNKEKEEKPEPSLNTVSLKKSAKKLNLPRQDSFLIKDKIFFKKKSNWIWLGVKNSMINLPSFILNLFTWRKGLNRKNRFLFTVLVVVLLIFLVSVLITRINNRRRETQQAFNDLVAQIEEKQNLVNSHLLYDDEEGAKIVLADVRDLLNTLPTKKKDQQEEYNRLSGKLGEQENKVEKIIEVDELEQVAQLTGLNVHNIVWVDGKIYSASNNALYEVTPGSENSIKTDVDANNPIKPYFDGKNDIYYWSDNKVLDYNVKSKTSTTLDINGLDENPVTSFRIFSSNLYVLSKDAKQIYRYRRSGSSFSTKTDWIKADVDLSGATDLAIDGHIYTLDKTGNVFHLYKGQLEEYESDAIMPTMNGANKLIVGENVLYILDRESKRIALLDKEDGSLIKQYQMDSLQNLTDFTVNEAAQEIYVLDNETINRLKME